MSGSAIIAFYVGVYVGGVAALWTAARTLGFPFRWRSALLWGAAFGEQLDKLAKDGKA